MCNIMRIAIKGCRISTKTVTKIYSFYAMINTFLAIPYLSEFAFAQSIYCNFISYPFFLFSESR